MARDLTGLEHTTTISMEAIVLVQESMHCVWKDTASVMNDHATRDLLP